MDLSKKVMYVWEHPTNNQVKKLKKKYVQMYKQLEPLVNEWDPIGLISSGAPEDEYDCITVQLISMLEKNKNENEIYEFIIREIDDHFGMGINSVSDDHKGNFIKKHRDFSSSLIDWYRKYNMK